MFTLVFTAKTPNGDYTVSSDTQAQFISGLKLFGELGVIGVTTKTDDATDAAAPADEAEKAKPSAEKKAKPAPKKEAAVKETKEPAADATEKVKVEDCTAAITAVANASSVDNALAVLKRFGVKRASELAVDQFADFVAYCKSPQALKAESSNEADASSLL